MFDGYKERIILMIKLLCSIHYNFDWFLDYIFNFDENKIFKSSYRQFTFAGPPKIVPYQFCKNHVLKILIQWFDFYGILIEKTKRRLKYCLHAHK